MRRWICFLVVAAILVGGGVAAYYKWFNKPPDLTNGHSTTGSGGPVVFYANGLSPEDRKVFYHLAEGSEVYPLDWLRVTKRVGSDKMFLEDMDRFGMLPDPDSEEKLPIGLTAATTRSVSNLGKMVGINCAACHVGQISYKGKSLRIDGAPNMFDGNMFFTELVESGQAILSSPKELIGFLHRLHENEAKKPNGSLVSRLLVHLEKGKSDLKTALLGRVDAAMKEAAKAETARWSLKPATADREDARKKLLEGVATGDAPAVLAKADTKGSPLDEKNADEKKNALQGTIDEVVVTVRLLKARVEFLKNLAGIGKGKPDWGFGRVDAFGSVRALYFEPDYVPNGPVSYPSIWAFNQNPWFHYDGNTTSVLQRNLGQALGVGAVFEPEKSTSTLHPLDSDRLEQLAQKIKTPAWPVDFFGPLDQEKVKKGAAHFKTHCADCHDPIDSTKTAPDKLFTPQQIGTDPQRALGVTADLAKTKKPFYHDLAIVLNKVTKRALDDSKVPADKQEEFNHGRAIDWRTTKKYAARPMWGVWATAPYLHNGSVPTLYDLLLPAKDRPKTFPLGHRDYDPLKVGYLTTVDKPRFKFDTTKVGNANTGHEYGVKLTDAERYELIEYLKTQ